MKLENLITEKPNINLTVSGSDLLEFAETIATSIYSKAMADDKLLTSDEACKFLKISNPTLWRWKKAGLIKEIKIGGKILFSEKELRKMLKH
jgi:excisionase family DNA binding protein